VAMRVRAIALACVLGLSACASHHGGDDDSTATLLTINPPTSTLTLQDGMPANEDFTAIATFPDGTTKDVTSDVTFDVDGAYGMFAAATLTMSVPGKATVTGTLDTITGQAEVIGMLEGSRVDPSLPANVGDLFGSGSTEDPSRVPTVVYPPAGVIVPRNLGDFEVHWTDASSNNVFEISLETDYADFKVYVPGGNGTGGGPDPSWMAFLATEWTASIGTEETITYQVRGADSTMPGTVGSADPQIVKLSNEEMLGGIYYWASAGTTSPEGIWRHDMSMPGQPAQEFETLDQTAGRCIACHVLSRDGTKMAITYDGGGEPADELDVASKTFQGGANSWNFGTYTPDGTQFLAVEAGDLVVRDQATQTVIGSMTSAGWVTHPDLSPDGTKLVYTRPTVTNCDWAFGGGQIYIRTYDQATLSFGPETLLVANVFNNYYPSFSPDNAWVLFNQSGDNTATGAYNNPTASIWVVKADGSAPPVELAKLNTSVGLTNSWGRWAPFAQTLGAASTNMFWVTASSKRDFGVRLVGKAQPQIWMTPFFPDRAQAQIDPSEVAFRLPFQNIDSSNHIAQWTQQVVGLQ
jgi:hypothetical protein